MALGILALLLFADVCDPTKLIGPYGFQLYGVTTVSGTGKYATSLGRLVFDGHGNLSGISSTMFSGFLLGNLVTGSYVAHTDCSLTWKLRNDTGAWQNFSGTLSPDLTRAQFRQTDPGGPQHGVLQKTADTCTEQNLARRYRYIVAGSTAPMQEGDP